LSGAVTDDDVAELVTSAHAAFAAIDFVVLNAPILNRASQSFSTAVGTLDALHLATALWLGETSGVALTFCTHDTELALAARTVNFPVEGA
jgi:NAD(P)-dependent dehydrogenase (short-subunit alcohol dehydrogenase family)